MDDIIFTQKTDEKKTVHIFLDSGDFAATYKITRFDFIQAENLGGYSSETVIKKAKLYLLNCLRASKNGDFDGFPFLGQNISWN